MATHLKVHVHCDKIHLDGFSELFYIRGGIHRAMCLEARPVLADVSTLDPRCSLRLQLLPRCLIGDVPGNLVPTSSPMWQFVELRVTCRPSKWCNGIAGDVLCIRVATSMPMWHHVRN